MWRLVSIQQVKHIGLALNHRLGGYIYKGLNTSQQKKMPKEVVKALKYAENGDMDAACDEALKQIEEKSYVDKLKQDVMRNFIKYGIACFKKDCKVVVSE